MILIFWAFLRTIGYLYIYKYIHRIFINWKVLVKCKTLLSHFSYFIYLTFLRHSTSLYNTGGVWVNWPIVCGFHICQVRAKPDFKEQLSHHKPGQRCFVRRDRSQTHPATCKLSLSALEIVSLFFVQLDPNPMASIPPWANTLHFHSLSQYG